MSALDAHLLIVDDDERIRVLLQKFLMRNGFLVTAARDAGHARRILTGLDFDMLILDVMMPGEDGLSLCRSIRETSQTPILLLTAKGETDNRIEGLEAGADDYVVKPYSPREMVARVQALLRRSDTQGTTPRKEYAGIVIDLDTHRVTREGKAINLSPTCFKLLETLIERPGVVYSRERLLSRVWGGDVFVEPRTVDVHIRRLRKAINANGGRDLVRTVRGAGYALDDQ